MRACRSIPVVLLALVACGKPKERPEIERQPQAKLSLGLASLPAETRVIIGISVARVAGSPLSRRLAGELLARDPDAWARLRAVLDRCELDVERDVRSMTIAMSEPTDVALLAAGRFDEPSLAGCVRTEVAGAGGQLREVSLAGRTLHGAISPDGAAQVWMVGDGEAVVLATSERWLRSIVDPAAPKLGTRADTLALLAGVDQTVAAWGVGYLPPGAGARLVEIAGGAIGSPARSVAFELDAATGLTAAVRLEMAHPDDAAGLAAFARGQQGLLSMAAQRFGLGRLVARIHITSEGATVQVALALDEAELRQVAAAFAPQHTGSNDERRSD
jgi:hypothetical protein